ncbi:MAG: anti-sigma F factor [Defluviitaleaceae bacterium]|nr:anti-sigma F factor [Defluviitaleaceae bacterium]
MNKICVKMESLPENISFARVAVTAFISSLDPSVDEVSDIKTAVSEGVTNAVIHGGADYVSMNLSYLDRTIIIEIADTGVGIEDIEAARQPLFTTKEDMERSGLGFTVMESFMDDVKVESAPGEGTTVTLTKTLKNRE